MNGELVPSDIGGISLPGPEVSIPARQPGFVMHDAECAALKKWIGRAKDRKRKFHVSQTWEFAAGLGVAALFSFITTQFVGLTDSSGNRTGVEADSWVAPAFLIIAAMCLLWALLAFLSSGEEESRMDDLMSDCEDVLSTMEARHQPPPPDGGD